MGMICASTTWLVESSAREMNAAWRSFHLRKVLFFIAANALRICEQRVRRQEPRPGHVVTFRSRTCPPENARRTSAPSKQEKDLQKQEGLRISPKPFA